MSMKGRQASETALKALTNVKQGEVYVVADSEGTDFLWVALEKIEETPAPSKWLKLGAASISGIIYVDGDYVPNDVLVSTSADGGTKTVKGPGIKYIGTVDEIKVKTENNGFKFEETKVEDETLGNHSTFTLDWDPDVVFVFDANA